MARPSGIGQERRSGRSQCAQPARLVVMKMRTLPIRLVAPVLSVLGLLPVTAVAAGRFDSASARVSHPNARQLSWTHELGAATNRVIVVGVTLEHHGHGLPATTVLFNGTPMSAVPGGVADASTRGHQLQRTQLFYLLDAALPPQGAYPVVVSVSDRVGALAGGSISLFGLAQQPPEAVAVAATDGPEPDLSTSLTTLSAQAWIVEAVGADHGHGLVATSPEQIVRYATRSHEASIAGSASEATVAGTHLLGWTTHGRARLTQVAAAFAPVTFPLSVSVTGRGSVVPASGTFVEGSTVELTATAAAGHRFASWGGDLSGTTSPALLTMDGPKTVTAAFMPDFELYGWATANGGTTGGLGGAEVVVDTLAKLKFYAGQPDPYVIKIYGTISGNESIRVRSNKSLLGIGSDARLRGLALQIGWNSEYGQIGNVIIRNIRFEKALAPLDTIVIGYGARNVWIDHCDFSSDREHGIDYYDGLLDINHGSDFITTSWSRFHDHYKTSLVGNSDDLGAEDAGHLTVSYHHNSFVNSGGRNPSVRFGLVHVFDNDYRDLDDYAIASRMDAQVVIENNWFENVNRPIRADTSLSPVAGLVSGVDTNVFVNCTASSITSPPATWLPPYSYPLDPVSLVPEIVSQWSGVGVVVFSGEAPPPTPPTFTVQPVSQTVLVGEDAGFSVVAAGTEPFTYQWSKDGVEIPGATEAILPLPAVQESDAGTYVVVVTNAGGSATSDPATLTVNAVPPPPPPPPSSSPLHELFADGERNNQALPDSAAWFGSSGASNLVASVGQLRQIVSSSRTFLAYFTDDVAAPLTLAAGQTITLDFLFQLTGFDSVAPASDSTFRIGLLRSVANPDAVSGTGFVATGPPNTNARVIGDFGSGSPGSNVFSIYRGYAALTSANAVGTATPVKFYVRSLSNPSLLGSTGAFTQVPIGTPTASLPMQAAVPYRGQLSLQHTGTSIVLTYTLTRVSDATVVMSHSVEDTSASMTEFDTVAFYLSKNASSATYDMLLNEVQVSRVGP
jgi:pectate lyase